MAAWIVDFLEYWLDFSHILNISITAGWLVLAILFLRLFLKKAPRRIHIALWGLVALRLLIPFSLESPLSLIPSSKTIPSQQIQSHGFFLQQSAYLDIVSNPIYNEGTSVVLNQTMHRFQTFLLYMTPIWLTGMGVLLVYTLFSFRQLRLQMSTAVLLRNNIYQSEHASTAFVLGLIHPKIYIPYHLLLGENSTALTSPPVSVNAVSLVIAHEQAHIRRRDHWWKALGFLLLTIHWFNPLMWLAYHLLCKDIELACDEYVIKDLNHGQRADYSQALLTLCVSHKRILACPLAFGEVSVSQRVLASLSYKAPSFSILCVSLVSCIIMGLCFLTDPIPTNYCQVISENSMRGDTTWDLCTYRMELDQQVTKGMLHIENWYNGNLIQGFSLPLSATIKDLTIRIEYPKADASTDIATVQISNNNHILHEMYVSYRESGSVPLYYFKAHTHHEIQWIEPNDELILAFLCLDEISVNNLLNASFEDRKNASTQEQRSLCKFLESTPYYQEIGQNMLIVRAEFQK